MGTYETGLARKQAHRHVVRTCACGRRLEGNGGLRHMRTCTEQLTAHGYRLDARMAAAVRDEYRMGSAHIIVYVEKQLGQVYLARRAAGNRSDLPWAEYRDLVWRYADEAAGNAQP